MTDVDRETIDALILALPESTGSAIYGLIDVFAPTGALWLALVGDEPSGHPIRPKILSLSRDPFRCGNAIPVASNSTIAEAFDAEIIVILELWLAPDEDLKDRYPEVKERLRKRHRGGSNIYSACSTVRRRHRTGAIRISSAASFRTAVLFPNPTSYLLMRADAS